jgi:hypothetical protein
MAKVGDRVKVNIRNAVLTGTAQIGGTPITVSGTIIEGLGDSWLVKLEMSVEGKNRIVIPKEAEQPSGLSPVI